MIFGCLNPLKNADRVSEAVKCIQLEHTVDGVLLTDEWKYYKQDSCLPL